MSRIARESALDGEFGRRANFERRCAVTGLSKHATCSEGTGSCLGEDLLITYGLLGEACIILTSFSVFSGSA